MRYSRFDRDRYPDIGPCVAVRGIDAVIAYVRATWPSASQEGSCGAERSWLVRRPNMDRLVAHHWPAKPWKAWDGHDYLVRVAPVDSSPVSYF